MEINKAKDILVDAKVEYERAVNRLEQFKRNVRKHAYPLLIKQTNAQKFNLEFEQAIAQDKANWDRWSELEADVLSTSLDLYEAELIWEVTKIVYRNDNVE